jgi:hypothetical protein
MYSLKYKAMAKAARNFSQKATEKMDLNDLALRSGSLPFAIIDFQEREKEIIGSVEAAAINPNPSDTTHC